MDISKIQKRLKLIQSFLELGEIDQLGDQIDRLKKEDPNNLTAGITESIANGDYSNATEGIIAFMNQSISIYEDPEIAILKSQIQLLEARLIDLENEISEFEKLIAEFNHLIHVHLGRLIHEIYNLKTQFYLNKKHQKVKYEEAYERIKLEFEDFINEEKIQSEKSFTNLNTDELKELKDLYRRGVNLCHPDKFMDEQMKDTASKIFIKLKDAYERQDLIKVREILIELESKSFLLEEEKSTGKEFLMKRIDNLKKEVTIKSKKLIAYKKSEAVKLMRFNPDITNYLTEKEKELRQELSIWKSKILEDNNE